MVDKKENDASKTFSPEPQSNREMMLLMHSDIKHLLEDQVEIKKTLSENSNKLTHYGGQIEKLSQHIDGLDRETEGLKEGQKEICTTIVKHETYFKILGALSILFPTALITTIQLIVSLHA